MARTPEQKAADEALTAAVEQAAKAYTDDGDGDPYTAVGTIYRDGDVPMHRALGLLEYTAARMRKLIVED